MESYKIRRLYVYQKSLDNEGELVGSIDCDSYTDALLYAGAITACPKVAYVEYAVWDIRNKNNYKPTSIDVWSSFAQVQRLFSQFLDLSDNVAEAML